MKYWILGFFESLSKAQLAFALLVVMLLCVLMSFRIVTHETDQNDSIAGLKLEVSSLRTELDKLVASNREIISILNAKKDSGGININITNPQPQIQPEVTPPAEVVVTEPAKEKPELTRQEPPKKKLSQQNHQTGSKPKTGAGGNSDSTAVIEQINRVYKQDVE